MFASLFRAESGDDRSPFGEFWFEPVSVRTGSGQRVSADTAMRLSTVFRCVRILSATMASLPLCFYKPAVGGRGYDKVTDHWLYRLLTRRPNRFQNAFEWTEMVQSHVVLRGTAYNRIVPDGRGGIAELQPLNPDRVKVEVLAPGNYRYRVMAQDGSEEILAPGAVFKLCGLSSNGLVGLSVIEHARESIGEGLAQQDYSARFFGNDARPLGGWIEMPGQFNNKPARDAWRESWQQAQSGVNRGKTAVLEQGMKYHEIGLNNRDSQFVEAKNAKVPDICRWFGVPPHLAFALDRATDNNIEKLSLEFIKFTMTEWAERWEAAIEDQLLDYDGELEVEFEMDNLARGEMAARAQFYQLGINGGWLTRNEAREREGLNPLPDLDEPLQPLNMVPAGTEPETPPAPGKDDTPEDDPTEARLAALAGAAAARVVRKETAVLERLAAKHSDPQAFAAASDGFYSEHLAYVCEALVLDEATARRWCDARHAEACAAQLGTPRRTEDAAAAELAALAIGKAVQTSAPSTQIIVYPPQVHAPVQVGGPTVNVSEQPAPVVTIGGTTVNVPEQPAPVVQNNLTVRGYAQETRETIERSPDGEITEVTRRVTKE